MHIRIRPALDVVKNEFGLIVTCSTPRIESGYPWPSPRVLDDVLVDFEDERARATLGVLAGPAAKT
jgi:hypothetical protein